MLIQEVPEGRSSCGMTAIEIFNKVYIMGGKVKESGRNDLYELCL
jgi:hypothetical protein